MFIDEAEITLKAGDGGDGSASFRREKFIPFGGPDGGDGGVGGSIYALGDENMADLEKYRFTPFYQAKNGGNGHGRNKTGANGEDVDIHLPLGTIIINTLTGAPTAEVLKHGERILILKGGAGGIGNTHFKSSTNRAPRQFTEGEEGESGNFKLVLKTIADAGLVGFPNAGKSSLMNLTTFGRPKIGAYPFTTLQVNVGVIEYPETYDRLVLADIPGLIEGASQNRGLGHKFLRHIERCKLLVFMIDMAGEDGRKPDEDYKTLLSELNLYNEDLLKKPAIVAANKMDEPAAAENLKAFKKKFPNVEIIPISCLSEEGIGELKSEIYKKCKAHVKRAENGLGF
ncbi:MAG: GTPase ObgE [Opitutales bacterium]|nr:GTPase ObgE [Opitutales bacterium]